MPTYTEGQRVQAHPATDAWMRGDRYGNVAGFTDDGLVTVTTDAGNYVDFHPDDLLAVIGSVTEPQDSPDHYIIRAGDLCYVETIRDGLVPCKVLGIYETKGGHVNVKVRITANQGDWRKGERETLRHPVRGLYKRSQVTLRRMRAAQAERGHSYSVSGTVRFYTDAGRLLP